MSSREVYPNASVVLVALEVRHPAVAQLSRSGQAKVKQLLTSALPLLRPTTVTTFRATVGGPAELTAEQVPRYSSRDRTMAVTFGTQSLVVETTRYERYERLRDIIELAVRARHEVDGVDGLERLGLRYIDEIRVPEVGESPTEWAAWIDPTLLGPASLGSPLGLTASQWQGLVSFENGPGRAVVLRYGPREGYAVDPGGDLKRPTPTPGPFFLLDIDSFWDPPAEVPEFATQTILATCDELHTPIGGLFESLITERLRVEVLRHAG